MKNVPVIIALLFFFSCSNPPEVKQPLADTLTKKDSLKKALSEDLPPSSEVHQFSWIYSAFADAAVKGNDTAFNVFISKELGLWIIDAPGALPHFTRVSDVKEYKGLHGKGLLPFNRSDMIADPKEEELPVAACDKGGLYNKQGCFTSEANTFRDKKIWAYAGLTPDLEKEVVKSAETITRTVINTSVGRFYFSLINGSWYITFIDLRQPCDA